MFERRQIFAQKIKVLRDENIRSVTEFCEFVIESTFEVFRYPTKINCWIVSMREKKGTRTTKKFILQMRRILRLTF